VGRLSDVIRRTSRIRRNAGATTETASVVICRYPVSAGSLSGWADLPGTTAAGRQSPYIRCAAPSSQLRRADSSRFRDRETGLS
jgi:hypothetical protein